MIDCKYRKFKFKNCAGDKIKKEVSVFFWAQNIKSPDTNKPRKSPLQEKNKELVLEIQEFSGI